MKNIEDVKLELGIFFKKLSSALNFLDLKTKEEELKSLRTQQNDPNLYADLEKSQSIAKQIKSLDNLITPWKKLEQEANDLQTLIDLAESEKEDLFEEILSQYKGIDATFKELEINLLFKNEFDANNAYLSIHPGAGGTESCDWASMLYRMYVRFAERRKFKVSLIDYQVNEEAGIKSATLYIEGVYAYGLLKGESGVHRLVRISPFDANKKRHTSFSSVYVSPEIDDDIEVDVNESDLRIDTYRSSGAGGQHVNTTDSAVRITHLPTGIVVTSQAQRSQIQNRLTAMKILRARIYEKKKQEKEESSKGPDKKKIEWGSQIRSYVFHPYYLIKDHRNGEETSDIAKFMDGDIERFIEAYLKT